MRRILALVIALAIAGTPVVAADMDDEQIIPPKTTSMNDRGVIFFDQSEAFVSPHLQSDWKHICLSTTDPDCAQGTWLRYNTFLGPCTSADQVDCIEGVVARPEGGSEVNGTPAAAQPALYSPVYSPDPSRNLPAPHEPMLYEFAGAQHKYGTTYVVAAQLGGGTAEDHKPGQPFGNFTANRMLFNIYAVNKELGSFERGVWDDSGEMLAYRADWGSSCVIVEDGVCWRNAPLPDNVTFTIKVRLKQAPPGWFFGRVTKPDLLIEKIAGGERWTVSAQPVRVPNAWGFVPKTATIDSWLAVHNVGEIAPASSPLLDESTSPGTWVRVPQPLKMGNYRDSTGKVSLGIDLSIKWLNYWMPLLGDKASSLPTKWSIRALEPSELNDVGSCFKDSSKVIGIVTTNSLLAVAGPPTFNSSTQSLEYRVASPHFKTNGQDLFLGTYDLVMRSETARCIYGFSNAPVQATISVISANGEQVTATAVQKEEKGWLYLGAYGFTFSAPTIGIKLTQPKAATSTGKPVSSSSKSPPKKPAITCRKGKVEKTYATKTCPTGWRKA